MSSLSINNFIAGSLESAYSSIWGSHEIWGQDLGTFMISRPMIVIGGNLAFGIQ